MNNSGALTIRQLVLAIIVVVVLAIFFLPRLVGSGAAPGIHAQVEEVQLANALEAHWLVFRSYPAGENSNVVAALSGNNSQKTVFLNFARTVEHPNEMVDPWETPFQIEFLQQTNFIIRSAGPNRRFGDKDDLIFNSISNDFVKP